MQVCSGCCRGAGTAPSRRPPSEGGLVCKHAVQQPGAVQLHAERDERGGGQQHQHDVGRVTLRKGGWSGGGHRSARSARALGVRPASSARAGTRQSWGPVRVLPRCPSPALLWAYGSRWCRPLCPRLASATAPCAPRAWVPCGPACCPPAAAGSRSGQSPGGGSGVRRDVGAIPAARASTPAFGARDMLAAGRGGRGPLGGRTCWRRGDSGRCCGCPGGGASWGFCSECASRCCPGGCASHCCAAAGGGGGCGD